MWSTPSDRELAEREQRNVRRRHENARTPTMTVEERIKRWREEPRGDETEDVVPLLVDAEEELIRLRALVTEAEQ